VPDGGSGVRAPSTVPLVHLPVPRTDSLRVVRGDDDADLYRAVFQAAPLAMAILDADGRIHRVNQALCDLVGHPAADLLGRPHESVGAPDDLAAVRPHPVADLAGGDRELHHRDGHTVWARVSMRTVRTADRAEPWTACVWEDVDERRRAHDRLARLALQDPLTGAANRALLDDRLTQALHARDRDGGVVAVLFCDVDDFKSVNDRFGHGFGDTLLEVVATRLAAAVRAGDTVARVGGDEFAVVSPLRDPLDADALLVRVGESLGDAIRVPGGAGLPLSVSVGMALADGPGVTAAELLDRADRQMYAVKRRRLGRSR
jgi:diguanylate cyclase (GGDEF)-like protein/PAS domain S-box-containing protein